MLSKKKKKRIDYLYKLSLQHYINCIRRFVDYPLKQKPFEIYKNLRCSLSKSEICEAGKLKEEYFESSKKVYDEILKEFRKLFDENFDIDYVMTSGSHEDNTEWITLSCHRGSYKFDLTYPYYKNLSCKNFYKLHCGKIVLKHITDITEVVLCQSYKISDIVQAYEKFVDEYALKKE